MVSNIFYFHPCLGKIPISTNIFQRGWNQQLDMNNPTEIESFLWWIQDLTLPPQKKMEMESPHGQPIGNLNMDVYGYPMRAWGIQWDWYKNQLRWRVNVQDGCHTPFRKNQLRYAKNLLFFTLIYSVLNTFYPVINLWIRWSLWVWGEAFM